MPASPHPRPEIGLCSSCQHAQTQTSAKGGEFWRCRAADSDPRLHRYPALPVGRCPGFAGRSASCLRSNRRLS